MGNFGMQEILILALILILLFGARKLPEIGRGLGEGIRGFRAALRGDDGSAKKEGEDHRSGSER